MTPLHHQSIIESPAGTTIGSWLSWVIIAMVTAGLMAMSMYDLTEPENHNNPPRISSVDLSQLETQGKTLILRQGFARSSEPTPHKDETSPRTVKSSIAVPADLDEGTINQRWCVAVLKNDMESPTAALEYLALTKQRLASARLELDEEQASVHRILERSLKEHEQGKFSQTNLQASDLSQLRKHLGWFADLLLASDSEHPELKREIQKQARSTFLLGMAVFFIGGFAILLGLILLVVTAAMSYFGHLQLAYKARPERHRIYLQTFSIWMLVFFGGQIILELILGAMDLSDAKSRLGWGLFPFLGSLVTLAWPWIRGSAWKEVVADIGWTAKNPLLEIGIGMMQYLMLLPFMLMALLVFIGLTVFSESPSPNDFSAGNKPSHPIQEFVAQGDTVTILLVVFMACVAAPIVEETMFRGVFYRSLRDASHGFSRWWSIGLACIVNSLIFAAIHPQGLLALPLLGTLAIGFSLAREQRDSLIGPMVMHGINNGLVSLLLFFFL